MDDIYFSKKKPDGGDPQPKKRAFEIPDLNFSEPTPVPLDPDDEPEDDEEDGDIYFSDYTPEDDDGEESPDSYAPYHGRQKKIRRKDRKKAAVLEAYDDEDEYDDDEDDGGGNDDGGKKKKKRRFGFLKKLLLLLVGLFVISFVFIFGAAAISGYTKGELEPNSYVSRSDLASSPLVKNILLLGVDGKDGEQSLRSDTMMLVSVDFLHAKVKLSSFMRDSWVEIPDYKWAKLNAACSHGGPQLVVDTLEYNFGVDIEHYVLVNFTMFTNIIDSLGGLDVEVTEKEAKFINRTTRWTVESGDSVHLNGAEALVYCRIRKLDSDYMRTFRQRKVIKALVAQTKKAGIPAAVKALTGALPMIETDLSPFELTLTAYPCSAAALLFDITSTRIPTDELSHGGWKQGQSVVEIDVEANADYLYDFIYTGKDVETDEKEAG